MHAGAVRSPVAPRRDFDELSLGAPGLGLAGAWQEYSRVKTDHLCSARETHLAVVHDRRFGAAASLRASQERCTWPLLQARQGSTWNPGLWRHRKQACAPQQKQTLAT